MKKLVLTMIGLLVTIGFINKGQYLLNRYFGKFQRQYTFESLQSNLFFQKANMLSDSIRPPAIIHYGLNDSHSRSWAQINKNGVVGITYFQRFENSAAEGVLIYKMIQPDGSEKLDTVSKGNRLEKSVLLFDSLANPHIFVASSTNFDQIIGHYYKDKNAQWQKEIIIHFYNQGGKYIYEISADLGPDNSYHLLILKTRSSVDSDDYWDAWLDAYLYHLTNASGNWKNELIHNYNMAYTYDNYIKTSSRQDIKVDKNGFVHVVFGEQINSAIDPSRLLYATNKTGQWKIEIALNYRTGSRDEAGWFPSLALNNHDVPYISCMYVERVKTGSALSCKLLLLERGGNAKWVSEIIAQFGDGYYGTDGREYTGGLSHLVFDMYNTPHIVFSDIASSHWGYNYLNPGNIRYGIFKNGHWDISTIYNQPLPSGFFSATEMYGICLLLSAKTGNIRIIGQELKITGENQYTCRFINIAWTDFTNIIGLTSYNQYFLSQNYPNPFNPSTVISYQLPVGGFVTLHIYDALGKEVKVLVNEYKNAGIHYSTFNSFNSSLSSGIYYYQLRAGSFVEAKKLLLIK